MIYKVYYPGELYHHGILGQKWGVRRFQNKDGTRTEAGKKRYSLNEAYKKYDKSVKSLGAKTAIKKGLVGAAGVASFYTIPIASGAGATIATGNPAVGMAAAAAGSVGGVAALTAASVKSIKIANDANKRYEELMTSDNPVKNNEILIKSGDSFVRVSLKNKENENKRMYVSYDKDKVSSDYYTKTWPAYLRRFAGNPDADVYQNTYKVKTDIVAPSLEKRKEIALSLIKSDKKIATELGKTYALDQVILSNRYENVGLKSLKEVKNKAKINYGKEAAEAYQKKYDEVLNSMKNASDERYFTAFNASIPKSEKLMTAYIKELKKDGYNAVFDDNAYSPAPFIVFNPKDFEQTGSKKID